MSLHLRSNCNDDFDRSEEVDFLKSRIENAKKQQEEHIPDFISELLDTSWPVFWGMNDRKMKSLHCILSLSFIQSNLCQYLGPANSSTSLREYHEVPFSSSQGIRDPREILLNSSFSNNEQSVFSSGSSVIISEQTEVPFNSSFNVREQSEDPFNSSFNASDSFTVPEGCVVLQYSDFVPWDNPDNLMSRQVEEVFGMAVSVVFINILFLIRYSCSPLIHALMFSSSEFPALSV